MLSDYSSNDVLPYTCPNCKKKTLGIINDRYCLECYEESK